MNHVWKGKTVIVTGGSFGIGKATALSFATGGAQVVIADRVNNEETLKAIKDAGGKAIFTQCDVSDETAVKNMVEMTVNTFGGLDYAVNNAGIEGEQYLCHELDSKAWDRMISVNLKGVWLCMKYQIPEILKIGKGAIVNVASIAGLVGFPAASHYVASKHGVIGLTKASALENTKTGIRINALCPGVIKTPMIDRALGQDQAVEEGYRNAVPMGRFGSAEEMADAILYLCSDASSYMTGQCLVADGGWTVQ
ncbi:MAG TPA: glucose 1-dehydrogenase [Saprospiraceae bacterium]|nr:glucose 1-dehydrogenase [Saprospiraceae bacterium]